MRDCDPREGKTTTRYTSHSGGGETQILTNSPTITGLFALTQTHLVVLTRSRVWTPLLQPEGLFHLARRRRWCRRRRPSSVIE
ncbi:hypothetical protein HYC85_022583 [Camellia sinensis]|uniref:Uncharacterized protein n=1 Tax=Camellia sinensis TaxID=4442 RepID=A0A7J7GG00_CAMSI|nr:hypothetical protein HYC85_022583 [Camellia sinensis]